MTTTDPNSVPPHTIMHGRDIGKTPAQGNHKFEARQCQQCGTQRWIKYVARSGYTFQGSKQERCRECSMKERTFNRGQLHRRPRGP